MLYIKIIVLLHVSHSVSPDDPSSSGKRDFEKVAITITFPPSGGIQEQEVFIPLVDDSINEASEEFVVLAELGGNTSRESNDDISFIRGGVAVVIIVDDDRELILLFALSNNLLSLFLVVIVVGRGKLKRLIHIVPFL